MDRHPGAVLRAVAAIALAMSCIIMSPWSATAIPLEQSGDPSQLAVEVPYRGTASRQLPEGWEVTACPAAPAPNLVTLSCENGRVTFTGSDYMDNVGEQEVTISLIFNGAPQSITYKVTLAPPRIEGPPSGRYGFPLGQGTEATIPFSDLPAVCAACTTVGPTYTAGKASPADAGSVSFSGSGLVFSPAPGFSGEAKLSFMVRDAFGQKSRVSTITVSVVAGKSKAPSIIADTVAVGPGEAAYGNALTNDLQGGSAKVKTTLASCGKAANGTVECKADGSYVYTPDAGFTGLDQFSYHLFTSPSGDQATGSVIVGIGADPMPVLKARPTAEIAPLMTPAIEHPGDEDTKVTGVFPGFRDALTDIYTP